MRIEKSVKIISFMILFLNRQKINFFKWFRFDELIRFKKTILIIKRA